MTDSRQVRPGTRLSSGNWPWPLLGSCLHVGNLWGDIESISFSRIFPTGTGSWAGLLLSGVQNIGLMPRGQVTMGRGTSPACSCPLPACGRQELSSLNSLSAPGFNIQAAAFRGDLERTGFLACSATVKGLNCQRPAWEDCGEMKAALWDNVC